MKIIIFDSSTIINLTMNGLLDILRELKKKFSGKFVITHQVKYETVDRPLNIEKFELGALKVGNLIDEKVLELPEAIEITKDEIQEKTREILKSVNHIFLAQNEFMHIIHDGEASCLALSLLSEERGIRNVIAIDERTTRLLGEKPENLHKLFERKFKTSIKMISENVLDISKIKFIRSSELMYIAYQKGLVHLKSEKVLEALLFATKFNGSSISREEIGELKKLG
jgi:predicted nucleic acid-binding protein